MKRFACLIILAVTLACCSTSAFAQSTVYIFMRSLANSDCTMSINGGEPFSIQGPFKKAMANVINPSMPTKIYHPAIKKCIIKEEGKALFAANLDFTNVINGTVRKMAAEIQLNLSEGSVHYIKVGAKGLNDIQIKEVDEKEGLKLLKNKKYKELPDYVEE